MIEAAELLIDHMSLKAERFMRAMAAAAPMNSVVTNGYRGRHGLLMLYGPGAERKLPLVKQHLARGGRVAMWDLGYWDRPSSMRLSIDTLHPTAAQLAMSPPAGRRGFALREDADPSGPIMLVGLGQKSVYAYGLSRPLAWEEAKLADLRRRFPGRAVLWRPKGAYATPFGGLQMRHGMPIDEALRGCSLVVCRHSNVAIDACIAGIPVECDDGAAHALYRHGSTPTAERRALFLRRLSWWQWSRDEADDAWQWIADVLRSDARAAAA